MFAGADWGGTAVGRRLFALIDANFAKVSLKAQELAREFRIDRCGEEWSRKQRRHSPKRRTSGGILAAAVTRPKNR